MISIRGARSSRRYSINEKRRDHSLVECELCERIETIARSSGELGDVGDDFDTRRSFLASLLNQREATKYLVG